MLEGILAGPLETDRPRRSQERYPVVHAHPGLFVEHRASGLSGVVVRCDSSVVVVRDRQGRDCPLRLLTGGFLVDGRAVSLAPAQRTEQVRARTASGSRAAGDSKALVARASRILVEGVQDAELVEKVWGDDLRAEGVVVERLDGMAHLAEAVLDFRPGPGRRLGVLLDHLVAGSKEQRAADALTSEHVLVTGTPFVDIWEAVRPEVAGIAAWPDVPLGVPWKEGVCAALGLRSPREQWRELLRAVKSYADLEAPLVGAVERLIDFVTE